MKRTLACLLVAGLLGGPAAPGAVVQLPTFSHFGVSTTVEVPDSGGGLAGGVDRAASGGNQIGGPLSPFTNSGIGSQVGRSCTHLLATIHDFEAMDEALLAQKARVRRDPGLRCREKIRSPRPARTRRRCRWPPCGHSDSRKRPPCGPSGKSCWPKATGRLKPASRAPRGSITRWSCAGPTAICDRKRQQGSPGWRDLGPQSKS